MYEKKEEYDYETTSRAKENGFLYSIRIIRVEESNGKKRMDKQGIGRKWVQVAR